MTTARRQARAAAVQILYFWQVAGAEPSQAIGAFFREHLPEATESIRTFTEELVRGTIAEVAELDQLIGSHAEHWRVERLALTDLQILRLATWELRHHHDETDAAVILNEALDLARTFSGDESVPFVNGVLDSIRRSLEKHREPK